MRTVDDVLRVAKSAGVNVLVEGYDLVLEHEADLPRQTVERLQRRGESAFVDEWPFGDE
jgi:hypothetical protein